MKVRLITFTVGVSFLLAHIATVMPCGRVAAQDFLDTDVYDRDTIYIHYSIFGDGFVKNGQIINLGIFGSNLAEELVGSEYALEEMRGARKYKIAGTMTNLVATTFSITGLVLAFRDNGDNDSRAFEIASIAVGGLCAMFAEGLNKAAGARMNRAVWLYNRDIASGRLRVWGR